MQLTSLDWLIVVVSLVLCYLPAMFYLRRARSSMAEFFTSRQSAPWWLVGTSMVATTFSTDTPNLVTDFVRSHGVSYNWVWWAFLLTGMATVFFYAQLWRRSGVLTDLEFYELRYSGRPAAAVRGFRAVYLGHPAANVVQRILDELQEAYPWFRGTTRAELLRRLTVQCPDLVVPPTRRL